MLEEGQFDTNERFAFGTAFTPDQRMLRVTHDDSEVRDQVARRWQHLALAIAFDTWIANQDRTVRNLLHRGAGDFVLIDHGEAIPSGMEVDGSVPNLLARLAFADVSHDELRAATRRVQEAADVLQGVDMDRIELASLSGHWDSGGMLRECCRFLSDRLPLLDELIVTSLGAGQPELPLARQRGANQ